MIVVQFIAYFYVGLLVLPCFQVVLQLTAGFSRTFLIISVKQCCEILHSSPVKR